MRPERKPLFHLANMHLGRDFHTWSLPARLTCGLGMTEACEDVCYALDFVFIMPSARKKHLENYERARNVTEFKADAYMEIRYKRIKLLRIHVSGDFYSLEYLLAWHWIARRCKTTKFLFYTRAWRAPEMREGLVAMASLPNVFAFWSEDRDTGPCDFPVGRRAFLCNTIQDELIVPQGVLVFRQETGTVRKFLNGSWVCAKEQGTKTSVTCSSCKLCIEDRPWPVASGLREGGGRDGSASASGNRGVSA